MKKISIIILLVFTFCIFSCKNTNSSESTKGNSNSSTEAANEDTQNPSTKENSPTILYTWVDKLRLRDKPSLKSKVIAEVKEGTTFIYLNEKTDFQDRINLRGTLYNEPWLKVRTHDGKEAWVFGGAVRFDKPVVDIAPSSFDKCLELRKDHKITEAFDCMQKVRKKELENNKKMVKETSEGLTFTLLTGKTVTYNSVKSENADSTISREFMQYLPRVGFFIVRNNHYEGGNYSLIDDKSGKETIISGFPKMSPEANYIFTVNADLVAGFEANGIEIYGFPKNRFKKIFTKDFENWEPHTPKWLDDNTVELTLTPPQEDIRRQPKVIKINVTDEEVTFPEI